MFFFLMYMIISHIVYIITQKHIYDTTNTWPSQVLVVRLQQGPFPYFISRDVFFCLEITET